MISVDASSPIEEAEAAEVKHRPKLRGLSHSIAFVLALIGGAVLLSKPTAGDVRAGGIAYVICAAIMFGTSGAYHFITWNHRVLAVIRRVDHAGVFLMIGGSYTAYWTLMPAGAISTLPLFIMWGCCGVGAITFASWTHMPRRLRAVIYSATGLSSIPLVLKLPLAIGGVNTLWVAFASAVYVAGSVVYAVRWPNPNPKWFGYHEFFHLMVVGAAGIQYFVLLSAHGH